MTSVTIQLPDELPSSLHRSPTELAKDVKLAAAIGSCRQGLVSQGRAAEIAGVPRADFIACIAYLNGRAVGVRRRPQSLPLGEVGFWPAVTGALARNGAPS